MAVDPVTICITYDLADGVSLDEFRRWSSEIDQPAARVLPGITGYEVFEVERVEEGGDMPDIIDVVQAESLDAWLSVDRDESMTAIVEEFFGRICKPGTARTYYTKRIPPRED